MKKVIILFVALLACFAALHAQDTLQQYAGKYTFPDGSPIKTLEVVVDNGKVSFSTAMGNIDVEKSSAADEFIIPAPYEGTAKFTRDDKGKINGVHIDAGGLILDGTRDQSTNEPKNEFMIDRLRYPLFPWHLLQLHR